MNERLILSGGTLLPLGERRDIIADATVVVEDGVILEISQGKHYAADRSTQVLDARRRLVMPGLVNSHTHLYQVLLRGVNDTEPLTPWLRETYAVGEVLNAEDCRVGAWLACLEALEGGVTTVCDHFVLNPGPELAPAGIEGMKRAGVRAVLMRSIMDSGALPPAVLKEEAGDALALTDELATRFASDIGGGMLTLMVGPNTPPINTSTGLIRAIGAFARQRGMWVSAHVAESTDIVAQCRAQFGMDVVEYLDSLGLVTPRSLFSHCVHLSEHEIDLLASRGASVAHNPVSNCMLGDGIAPVARMVSAGVNVSLGTDGAASNHSQDMFEVMKVTSLLQRVATGQPGVLDPYDILRMATAGGAKSLGLEDRIGTVEVGKRADLIVVDPFRSPHGVAMHNVFTHLVHALKSSDVETTIVDGRVVMRDRVLVGQDTRLTMSRAQAQAQDLVGRIRGRAG